VGVDHLEPPPPIKLDEVGGLVARVQSDLREALSSAPFDTGAKQCPSDSLATARGSNSELAEDRDAGPPIVAHRVVEVARPHGRGADELRSIDGDPANPSLDALQGRVGALARRGELETLFKELGVGGVEQSGQGHDVIDARIERSNLQLRPSQG